MSDPYRSPPTALARTGGGSWACPRCGAGLGGEELAGVRLDRCIRCDGVFVTAERLTEVIEHASLLDELRAVMPSRPRPGLPPGSMYVKCPVCATLMNRRQYADGARVVIDVCRQHGVWFEAGELVKVLDFVARGGLAQARAREAARRSEADHRARVRASVAAVQALAERTGWRRSRSR